MLTDKGRYRQLRTRSQSPETFQPEPPPNIHNLGSSARISRVGTEFDPPQEGQFGIVDANVLYHALSERALEGNKIRYPIPV